MPAGEKFPTFTRRGAYGAAVEDERILLTLKKSGPYQGKWDLPGGKIESGETSEEALRREFVEEVGMKFISMELIGDWSHQTEFVESGSSCLFLHYGEIYRIEGLVAIQEAIPEEIFMWHSLHQLNLDELTPFAKKTVLYLIAS